MAIELREASADRGADPALEDLHWAYRSGTLILFVGAGLSVAAGRALLETEPGDPRAHLGAPRHDVQRRGPPGLAVLGVKDLRRFDEKAVKLMMLAFISLSRLFYPLSEKEMAQGYCDLFLGVSPLYPAAKHAWLLELKYLPTGAKAGEIERAFQQAAAQVERYAGDAALVPLLTQGQALKAGSLVFVGTKKPLFRPWPPALPARAKARRRSRGERG